jgi:hypothetical protein
MAKIKTIDGRELGYEEMMDLYEKYKACETFGERLELWDEYGLDEFVVNITNKDNTIRDTISLHAFDKTDWKVFRLLVDYLKERALQKKMGNMGIGRVVINYERMVATYWERMCLSPKPTRVIEWFLFIKEQEIDLKKTTWQLFNDDEIKFDEEAMKLAKRWGYEFANTGFVSETISFYHGLVKFFEYLYSLNGRWEGSLAFEGELVLQFEEGIELAKFHGFLEEQKERLQRGDDIQYPEKEEEKQVREYIEKEKGRLKMKWGKSKEALYQLMADLLGNYIQPDNTTLLAEWIEENFEDMPQPSTIRPRIAKLRGNNDKRPRDSYDAEKIEKLE